MQRACTWVALAFLTAACGDSGTSGSASTTSGSGGATSATTSTSGNGSSTGSAGGGGSFAGVDPLAATGPVELVQGGFGFTEGPCWFAALGVLRFTDQSAGIFELAGDVVSPWWPGGSPNGLAVAPNGSMIACYPSSRSVQKGDAATPSFSPLTNSYMGSKLNAPNDVIVRSDGNVYFTDPDYGLPAQDHELGFNGVYRVAPDFSETLVTSALTMPNGIALSPDETILYVDDEANAQLYKFDVQPDGTATNGMLFMSTSPNPDGMAVDDAGNLYLATLAGIDVYKPDGMPWGTITVPEQPANAAFGGADRRTLFITARTGLYRVHLNVPGKP